MFEDVILPEGLNRETLEHLMNPKNYGKIEDADCIGVGIDNATNSYVIMYIKSDETHILDVMFGTNALIHERLPIFLKDGTLIYYKYDEKHYGLTIATGLRFMFGKNKRHGFDIDLNFITYSTINKRIDELSKPDKNGITVMSKDDKPFFLKFSAGYRLSF